MTDQQFYKAFDKFIREHKRRPLPSEMKRILGSPIYRQHLDLCLPETQTEGDDDERIEDGE